MLELYGEKFQVKDYDCSFDIDSYPLFPIPILNVYVQVTSKCNAECAFCKREEICEDFDYEKFDNVLNYLSQKIIIGKVAITGGEPLLFVDKVHKIIQIAKKYSKVVTLNTNAFFINELAQIYPLVDFVDVSRHHFSEIEHCKVMNLNMPTLHELMMERLTEKITINCVMQKGLIDSYEKVVEFLEYVGKFNIKKVKFISLLPLTTDAISLYINPEPIIEMCKNFLNSGTLYDHDMCSCFEFMYLTKEARTVTAVIRNTTNSHYFCIKQFVFNGKYLYSGFDKKHIII